MLEPTELVFALLIGLSLSACCGLRAFLPLAAISVLGWTGHLTLGAGFEWLAEPTTALALSLAAIIEIVADKGSRARQRAGCRWAGYQATGRHATRK